MLVHHSPCDMQVPETRRICTDVSYACGMRTKRVLGVSCTFLPALSRAWPGSGSAGRVHVPGLTQTFRAVCSARVGVVIMMMILFSLLLIFFFFCSHDHHIHSDGSPADWRWGLAVGTDTSFSVCVSTLEYEITKHQAPTGGFLCPCGAYVPYPRTTAAGVRHEGLGAQ